MNGTLETHWIHSRALEGNALRDPSRRELLVYLPPSYAQASDRLPVVYFLHAFGNSVRSWTNFGGFGLTVLDRVDRLVSSGALPKFIGVFVDGWTTLGGTQWINSPAVGRYGDYAAQEVVAFVDRTYRTVPDRLSRAVVGHSSGGYGALAMGRKHPDVFGHIGSHSGDAYFEYCYLPEFPKAAAGLLKHAGVPAWLAELNRRATETKIRGEDFPVINIVAMAAHYSPNVGEPLNLELPFEEDTARIRPGVWARWLEHDPVRFVRNHAEAFRSLRSVFVDCGSKDEFHLRWGARMVAQALRDNGVEHVHEEFEDGHSGVGYRFERSLAYLVPRMTTTA